jgi:subtilase family serine protease
MGRHAMDACRALARFSPSGSDMRMRTRAGLSGVAVLGMVAAGLTVGATAQAAGTTTVAGNVPAFATAAHRAGAVSGSARLTVTVYLTPRNMAGLRSFLRDLYRPGSASYHHYLTPAQFHARYSPTTTTVSQVKSFLSHAGLKVGTVASNRMYIDATGTVAQVEKAFQVTQAKYRVQGHLIRSNAQAPRIPSSLGGKVLYIGGLDASQTLVHPAAAPPAPTAPIRPCNNFYADQVATVTPPAYQYGSQIPFAFCGMTPQQIRVAYGLPADWQTPGAPTGEGVRIGITDAFASPTEPFDVNRFSSEHGLPTLNSSNFTQLVVPGTFHFPENLLGAQNWYGEESLDLVAVHSMAPKASITYVGAVNNEIPLDHALEALIDSHRVDVITNSWGYNGEPSQLGLKRSEQLAFMQAAAEGISVLFSSGDDGDVGALTGLAQGSWPATSDWVTAVGGTSLLLRNASGAKSEYGWGTYFSTLLSPTLSGTTLSGSGWSTWPPAFYAGSGGGPSPGIAQPWYKKGVVGNLGDSAAIYSGGVPSGTLNYATPRRVVPDVAMDADPYTGLLLGETFTTSSFAPNNEGCTALTSRTEYCETTIGGTSLASPLFAGVLALVDQRRFENGLGSVGFVNPALYGSARSALTDVLPPPSPLGFVRTRQTPDGLSARFITINSTVTSTTSPVIEGADTSLRTRPGYDDVTGLGAPRVHALIVALGG